jgi:hypothetical protein
VHLRPATTDRIGLGWLGHFDDILTPG